MAVGSPETHLQRAYDRLSAAKAMFRSGHVEDGANRLYYVVFEAGNAALKFKGRRIPGGKHNPFLALFDKVFSGSGREWNTATRTLSTLASARNSADYAGNFNADTYDAVGAVDEAEAFVRLVHDAFFPDFVPARHVPVNVLSADRDDTDDLRP